MTELEIRDALSKGLKVYWSNLSYSVSVGIDGHLMTDYEYNRYYCRLQSIEYVDCFKVED